MKDTAIISLEVTTNVVRQKIKGSLNEHVSGSRVIIDDVLLHSTSLGLVLLLLECYMRVYLKYRESFKQSKCDFLSERFELVGRNITPIENTTASSKYDLITDWKQPTTSAGLHSFVSLINFYKQCSPLFELKAKPLRNLYIKYLHKDIPISAWTTELQELFQALKVDITSSPIMARYDSSKPCFLKTDWSSRAMSFILMQPDNCEQSTLALSELKRDRRK